MYFHFYCKSRCFWRSLHCWQNLYTAAGSDGIDKFQLCLIDVTLACEDANSKLVEVVNVADVDDEKRVDDD